LLGSNEHTYAESPAGISHLYGDHVVRLLAAFGGFSYKRVEGRVSVLDAGLGEVLAGQRRYAAGRIDLRLEAAAASQQPGGGGDETSNHCGENYRRPGKPSLAAKQMK
jgi:hypothetical protein